MVLGIVVLHVPPYTPLGALDGTALEYIKAFFSHGVFRATVPVLTALSGFLVFYSGMHLKPRLLLQKKSRTILIPLLLWNIPLALAVYALQRYDMLGYDFRVSLYPFSWQAWADAVVGLAGTPVNYPLNFLRDLFVVSLFAPLFWQLLKRAPYTGLVVVFLVYFFDLEGPIVIRNSMLVTFYIGALAAHQQWNLTALDRYAPYLFGVFIAFCIAIVAFEIQNREPLRLVSPFLVWPAMSLIAGSRPGNWLYAGARHSFFTFLAHGPLLLFWWVLYLKIPNALPYPLFWFGSAALTIALAAVINTQFGRRLPRLAGIMLGSR